MNQKSKEIIYPGHGKMFKIEKAFVEFERWKMKAVTGFVY
jgi:hypothetical protein